MRSLSGWNGKWSPQSASGGMPSRGRQRLAQPGKSESATGRHVRGEAGMPHDTRLGQHAYPRPITIALLSRICDGRVKACHPRRNAETTFRPILSYFSSFFFPFLPAGPIFCWSFSFCSGVRSSVTCFSASLTRPWSSLPMGSIFCFCWSVSLSDASSDW